jgi:hypothetical protein
MSDTEIRLIDVDDADAIAAYCARDADAFTRWEPSRPANFDTADGHSERIEQLPDDHRNSDRWPGVVLADGSAIGQVTVSPRPHWSLSPAARSPLSPASPPRVWPHSAAGSAPCWPPPSAGASSARCWPCCCARRRPRSAPGWPPRSPSSCWSAAPGTTVPADCPAAAPDAGRRWGGHGALHTSRATAGQQLRRAGRCCRHHPVRPPQCRQCRHLTGPWWAAVTTRFHDPSGNRDGGPARARAGPDGPHRGGKVTPVIDRTNPSARSPRPSGTSKQATPRKARHHRAGRPVTSTDEWGRR